MVPRLKSRRVGVWVTVLCLAVGLVLFAAAGATAITPAECDAQVNNTPSKLLPCIQTNELMAHMQAFQAIADANPGPDGMPSRNSGEPGYKASADYVAQVMEDAGYNVTIQTYKFFYFAYTALPVFKEISPTAHDFVVTGEFNPGQSTGSDDCGSSTGWGHRHPADSDPELVERLHRGRLRRLRTWPDRFDPARNVLLRREGA